MHSTLYLLELVSKSTVSGRPFLMFEGWLPLVSHISSESLMLSLRDNLFFFCRSPMRTLVLGKRPFGLVLELQEAIFKEKIARQRAVATWLRENKNTPLPASAPFDRDREGACKPLVKDTIIVVEHADHVMTIGRRDTTEGLAQALQPSATAVVPDAVVKLRRGGGLTYHGPGQITVYPLVNVREWWKASTCSTKGSSPVRWYSDVLEDALVKTCKDFGLPSHGGCTGAWITQASTDDSSPSASCSTRTSSKSIALTAHSRKIGSIGLQLSDWVSMHGVSFNVDCDLAYFDSIVMCEMPDRRATSLHRELNARRELSSSIDLPSIEACGLKLMSNIICGLTGTASDGQTNIDAQVIELTRATVPDSQLLVHCQQLLLDEK